jgi:hypothetical protein
MTQDEIMEMARKVGYPIQHPEWQKATEELVALVAAKEREACAQVCEDLPAPDIYSNTDMSMWDVTCIDCAAAIRARGEQA